MARLVNRGTPARQNNTLLLLVAKASFTYRMIAIAGYLHPSDSNQMDGWVTSTVEWRDDTDPIIRATRCLDLTVNPLLHQKWVAAIQNQHAAAYQKSMQRPFFSQSP